MVSGVLLTSHAPGQAATNSGAISEAVYRLLFAGSDPRAEVSARMGRNRRTEHDHADT